MTHHSAQIDAESRQEIGKECSDKVPGGYLYRHFDADGVLLYVGISLNAVARLAQHRGQTWFPRIATITVQPFPTYDEAQIAELRAICSEGPIHNVHGPRDAKDLGPALTRLRRAQRRAAAQGSRESRLYARFRGAFDIDKVFGCIPSEMTFEEYIAEGLHKKNGRT